MEVAAAVVVGVGPLAVQGVLKCEQLSFQRALGGVYGAKHQLHRVLRDGPSAELGGCKTGDDGDDGHGVEAKAEAPVGKGGLVVVGEDGVLEVLARLCCVAPVDLEGK